ncbi:hypothetical protein MMC22_007244 [Lobaria immixta]|nr:hypothetical protein [Lobaria immixta]
MVHIQNEIWGLILDQVYLDSPRTVGSVLLASKRHYDLSVPYIYRSIGVHQPLLAHLDDKESIYTPTIRDKIEKYTEEIIIEDEIEVKLLIGLIPSVRKLNSLRWRNWTEAMPTKVLEKLTQHHSSPRLCIEELPTDYEYSVLPNTIHFHTFTRLLHSTSLYLIDVTSEDDCGKLVTLLKKVIRSCRNLKVLRLNLSSRMILGWTEGLLLKWNFRLDLDGKFPPLQELVLSHYNGERTSAQGIFDFWDWSELRVLKLQCSKFYSILQSMQGLQLRIDTLVLDEYNPPNYSFNNGYHRYTNWPASNDAETLLDSFVLSCSGIQSLHVCCLRGRLPLPTISKHGSLLKSLTTREYIRWNSRQVSELPALSTDDLTFLNANCPHLESLGVDMERSDQWDDDFLYALTRFPRLHTLRLYIGLPSGGEFVRVSTSVIFARRAFRYFRASKVGSALHVLYVCVAEPETPKWHSPVFSSSAIGERVFKCYLNGANKLVVEDSYLVDIARKEEESQRSPQDVEIIKRLEACDKEMGAAGKDFDEVFAQAGTADDNGFSDSGP